MFRKVRVREDAGGVKCLQRSPQVADQASWAIHLNLTKYLIFFRQNILRSSACCTIGWVACSADCRVFGKTSLSVAFGKPSHGAWATSRQTSFSTNDDDHHDGVGF